MARLFLVAPVIVAERVGSFTAIARSWKLTDDSAWQLVLLFVLALLAILGLSLIAGGLGGAVGSVLLVLGSKGAADFAAALVPAVLSTVVAMASAVAGAVVYRRRDAWTGPGDFRLKQRDARRGVARVDAVLARIGDEFDFAAEGDEALALVEAERRRGDRGRRCGPSRG